MSHILVVEDDPSLLPLLSRCLTKLGHTVVTSQSAQGGLEAVRSQRFDLLLCDLHLGQETALGLLTRVAELQPACKIVVSSGVAAGELPYPFLPKPYDLQQLRQVVSAALSA